MIFVKVEMTTYPSKIHCKSIVRIKVAKKKTVNVSVLVKYIICYETSYITEWSCQAHVRAAKRTETCITVHKCVILYTGQLSMIIYDCILALQIFNIGFDRTMISISNVSRYLLLYN